MGDAGHHGHGPAEGGDDGGPAEVGEGEDVEGPADGEVALQGEGHDGQHAGVGGALRQEGAQAAEHVPEQVRVLVPEDRQLVRKAWCIEVRKLYSCATLSNKLESSAALRAASF